MDDDREYQRLVRREAAERVDRILHAMREPAARTRWDEVYRHAHTLAGIAPDLDAEMAKEARRLTEMLLDARGNVHAPAEGEAEAEARKLALRLSARIDPAPGGGAPQT